MTIMKILIRDAIQDSRTGTWRRVLINVSVCLLTSRPISNVIFSFAPLGMVLRCMKTPNDNETSNLNQFFGLHIDFKF